MPAPVAPLCSCFRDRHALLRALVDVVRVAALGPGGEDDFPLVRVWPNLKSSFVAPSLGHVLIGEGQS